MINAVIDPLIAYYEVTNGEDPYRDSVKRLLTRVFKKERVIIHDGIFIEYRCHLYYIPTDFYDCVLLHI